MATLVQSLQHLLSQKEKSQHGSRLLNETKRMMLKEYLQAYTLDYLYNHSEYRKLNFYGGTCLHIVYGFNRLSEHLVVFSIPSR